MAQPGGNGIDPVEQPSRISQLKQHVADVKSVMTSNVERILERGERLETLEGRTEALSQSSENFRVMARRVERHMCRKNLKWTIIVGVSVTVVVIIILLMIINSFGGFSGGSSNPTPSPTTTSKPA
ncbi:hypothetical protein AB6A40_003642 [Gnathostoma spinigerum]|uniref:V-SNARE coiled-coil homology domain-containing protein n=1 Tax=Gnathostoma spinigerum TaxID=75299 RepID=A0ABD6EIY4_9BILA